MPISVATAALAVTVFGYWLVWDHDDGTRSAKFTIVDASDGSRTIKIDVEHDGCESIDRIKVHEESILIKIDVRVREVAPGCGSATITERRDVQLDDPIESRTILGGVTRGADPST